MAEKKKTKDHVVSFRVVDADAEALERQVSNKRIVGIRSANQLCRKVVIDFLRGSLTYSSNRDGAANPVLS